MFAIELSGGAILYGTADGKHFFSVANYLL